MEFNDSTDCNKKNVFEIKICGVRVKSDVDAVAMAAKKSHTRAAIGLNFYPASVRYVDPSDPTTSTLSDLASQLGLIRVGVFVNESVDRIEQVCSSVGLDEVQLHGDEPIATAAELIRVGHRVLRAIKLPSDQLTVDRIEEIASPWKALGCHLLLDADGGAAHGGSGRTLDWDTVAKWAAANRDQDWTLAGGLTPNNIAQAISQSTATSVDTASGVEAERGTKSDQLIHAFFDAASAER